MTLRQDKVNSVLQETISSYVSENTLPALTTIMYVDVSPDLKSATVYVSIFPEDKEVDVLNLLNKKISDLKRYVNSKLKMKFLPTFKFEIDRGEKQRRRIDELLNK